MNDKFEKKIKHDFASSTPDVLDKIKQSNRFKVPEVPKKQSISDIFKLRKVRYTFASLFLVVLVAIVMINRPAEQIYASTVTLDINPQIEITVDEDDKVMAINALNDDGTEIISELGEYKRHELQEVITTIVQKLYQNGYLDEPENFVMVYVNGVNQQVQERIQQVVENKLQEAANQYQKTFQFVRRNNLDYTNAELLRIKNFAEENNIHPGRVILILEILDNSDSYTKQELAQMSMRELYNTYLSLFPDDTEDSNGAGNSSNGSSNGN